MEERLMTSGNVKGITIEFEGNTTKLSKAINEIRGEAKALDKELGYINKALKFDPKNVDLLKQKMTVLDEATSKNKGNIEKLKKALQTLKSNGVDETSAEYRELQREIVIAEAKQKSYNKELNKLKASTSVLGQASQKMADFGSAVTKAGESLRGISMVAGAVDVALAGLTVKAGQSADDLNTLAKVTGIGTDQLQKYKLSADLMDVSVESIAKSQQKLKKNMLGALDGTNEQAQYFEQLGINIQNTDGSLRNASDVFDDTIEALGKMENETERDAIAMALMGKSANELNPLIEDGGETYKKVADIMASNGLDIVNQETLDKANQFNDALDTIKLTGMATLSTVGTQLAGYLAPAMEKIADALGKVFGWLSQLDPEVLTIIGIVAGVVAILAPLLITIGKIATGISAIMGLMSTLGVSLGAIGGALLPIIGIIAGVIAVGVLLYKNWDTIKEKATQLKDWVVEKWTSLKNTVVNTVTDLKNKIIFYWNALKLGVEVIVNAIKTTVGGVWDSIKTKAVGTFNLIKTTAVSIWNGIKKAITDPIGTAVDFVKTALDKIKGFFSGLTLELPHIKLPHFKLEGSFSLVPPSIPKISVDWYKNGGIFTNPTIFPASGIGVGEAGAEAVLPLKKLWEEMDKRYDSGITINVTASPGMDVNELASLVEAKLISAQKRRRLAW